jgi:polysaccharide export outer membrane protein
MWTVRSLFDHTHLAIKNIKLPYDNFYVYGILTSRNRSAIRVALIIIITYHLCRTCPQQPFIQQGEDQLKSLQQTLVRRAAGVVLAGVMLALTACATTDYPSLAADRTQVPQHEYLIGPGDTINITVWRNPEVSLTVPVRPDGKITTPLVQDMNASGKTATQLARDLEKSLEKYIQQPIVTVIVTGFVGPYSEQIRVIGQATKPQALPYRENMSLMDVLIAVGGITEFASGNKAVLIRNVDGKQQTFALRLNDLIKRGDLSANASMRPGDVLVIPESFF